MRKEIITKRNEVYLSTVSIWECIVKHKLGRLPLPELPSKYITEQRKRHQILTLPLDENSVIRLDKLPLIHNDPFDRMLICQAIEHELTLITVDSKIHSYSVDVWK